MIKFEKVFIKYTNAFMSLYNFNCEIKSHTLFVGDFFNGTTAIMRLLAKIDTHYEGNIIVDNINIKNIKDNELDLAYLPERPVLFHHKSIKYNLTYPLKIRKIKKVIIESKFNALLSEFNLEFLTKKIKRLSLSEQQIIILLRALMREPKYILLEHFFDDFDKNYLELAFKILNKIKEKSVIIACEKTNNIEFFNNFKTISL